MLYNVYSSHSAVKQFRKQALDYPSNSRCYFTDISNGLEVKSYCGVSAIGFTSLFVTELSDSSILCNRIYCTVSFILLISDGKPKKKKQFFFPYFIFHLHDHVTLKYLSPLFFLGFY